METPEYVAGCKALGLVSYFITTPLWCLVEDMNVHIMDLPPYCREMITYIDECIEKTETFIEGGIMLSFSHFEENVIYRSLIKPWQHDGLVISILKSVLTALSVTVRRLFADYLDANFENSSDIEREKCRAVPKHNKFSESIFGHVDRLLREKPSITTIAKEAIIMFCHNKTAEWLENHRDSNKLVAAARNDVKSVREKFKKRKIEIEVKRKEIVLEKLRVAEELEQQRLAKLQRCTDKIIEWGLWQTEDQVDHFLSVCKTKKEKMEGLKAQFSFRKEVLKQKPNDDNLKTVYALSKCVDGKRTQLTIGELTRNLKSLVQHAFSIPATDDEGQLFVGKNIRMKFTTDGQTNWETGFVISKVIFLFLEL